MANHHAVIISLCCFLLAACGNSDNAFTSTLISNAVIYDGSGADPVRGAVRFDNDRIVAVGDLEPLPGETIIDADGQAVAPGFIDTHSHHDEALDQYRHMPGVLSQGITTIVRGLDGFSDDADRLMPLSLADFGSQISANPTAVNIASYSAHNSIRRQVMGDDYRRPASEDEVAAMAALVAADMEAGALGLATGLEYDPGIYSTTDEVIELARTAAEYGGRYASHLRDEDDRQDEAIEEILRIAREADIPVHVSHIKIADRARWGRSTALLRRLDTARADGLVVTADIYPYQRWASDLTVLFPDRNFASVAAAEFTFAHTALPEDIVLSYFPANPEFAGRSVAEIASILEKDPKFVLLELTQTADDYFKETGRTGSGIIAKGMDENDVITLMQWPHSSICSDGGHGGGHPRGYGAFPRVLGRYVRDIGALSLQEAIRKMTSLSAELLQITDRGLLKRGYFADLLIFDPETIIDRATMSDSTAVSDGITSVWVNGVLTYDSNGPAREYSGRLVKRREP